MTVHTRHVEGPVYLDYNATTPVDPAVAEAMLPYLTGGFGNPSSDHHYGTAPRAALEQRPRPGGRPARRTGRADRVHRIRVRG